MKLKIWLLAFVILALPIVFLLGYCQSDQQGSVGHADFRNDVLAKVYNDFDECQFIPELRWKMGFEEVLLCNIPDTDTWHIVGKIRQDHNKQGIVLVYSRTLMESWAQEINLEKFESCRTWESLGHTSWCQRLEQAYLSENE